VRICDVRATPVTVPQEARLRARGKAEIPGKAAGVAFRPSAFLCVNAIAPGVLPAARALRMGTPRGREILIRTPRGRCGTLEEPAGAAMRLASGASSSLAHRCIAMDGG